MEFHEKLQQLRTQRGLTQEMVAQALYVSRTAVSKWESGRGYPNIDSLKAISKFYSVSIDDLLSGEELLTLAEEDHKQKEKNTCDIVFGLLDLSAALLLFLPFFGQRTDGAVQAVSLLVLTGVRPYLKAAYLAVVIGAVMLGILTLVLQNCGHEGWVRNKNRASLLVSTAGVLLFTVSRQPYGAVYLFVFLMLKGNLLKNRP